MKINPPVLEYCASGPSKVFIVGKVPYVFIILKPTTSSKRINIVQIKTPVRRIPGGTRLFTYTENCGVDDETVPKIQKV